MDGTRLADEPSHETRAEEAGATGNEHGHATEDTLTDAAAYNDAHYARAFPDGYMAHFWHRARLRIVLAELAKTGASAVLDIGCGPGQYVRALREAGYDCIGCDPGDAAIEPGLAPYVFARTSVEEIDAATLARVDTALLLDVIEHLPDPAALLARIGEVLPGLKTLVVTVPARQELWSELDRRARHERRFRLDELDALLTRAGFFVTTSTYLFRVLYPAALLTARRAKGRAVSSPKRPRVHDVLGRLLALDRLLPARLPGTSALCVARPRRPDDAGSHR